MRGLFLFTSGMEDNEALSTMALLRRAKVDIDMVPQPCKERGVQPEDTPYSFSTAK